MYYVVKLMPNTPSWCDRNNNIYLTRPNKMSKRLKDGCDMARINKGVKAGLIKLEIHYEDKQEVSVPQQEEVLETPINENMDLLIEEVVEEADAVVEEDTMPIELPEEIVEEIEQKIIEK